MPVALCNCVPIPADAAPGSFNVAAAQIAARITPRTRAIVVAHIAGIPVAMKPVMKLAKALGLPVIEDCAQAHGATCNGRLVGSWGTIAAFSTMFGKHHATGGQGGVVFTRDAALFDRARRCADRGKPFGLPAGSTNVVASLNFNSNDLNACIGRVQLRKLPKIVAARRRNAGWLAAACRRELQTVRILEGPPGTESSYWFLFVQLDLARLKVDKQTFAAALGAEGVPAGASYRHLFTEHEWYRQRAVFPGTTDPWGNPRYKGNPARKFALPNINRTDTCTFPLFWHERLAARDLARVLAALKKVERAYLK
jgi:dTDP-4-amino-4,6-dideoxygalactose transaminase